MGKKEKNWKKNSKKLGNYILLIFRKCWPGNFPGLAFRGQGAHIEKA